MNSAIINFLSMMPPEGTGGVFDVPGVGRVESIGENTARFVGYHGVLTGAIIEYDPTKENSFTLRLPGPGGLALPSHKGTANRRIALSFMA